MRRLGAKGGKRRKSETSSDADSGENGGGNGGTANESVNSSDAGNNIENTETPVKATSNNKKRSRPRSKRADDSGSVATTNSDDHNKNDAEMGEEQTSIEPDTTPVAEKENGSERKSSAKKRKKDKSKTAAAAASTSQDNDNEYEVEQIVAHRTIKGRRQFLVRWKGYNEDSDTWEQEKDLNCPKLIDDFLADEEDKQEEEHPSEESEKNENENDNDNENSAETEIDTTPKSKKTKKSIGKKDKNKQPQNAKKQEAEGEEEGEAEETKEFEVEKIIEVHFKKNKEREFLIRWKGFNANDDTWEPEENLNCPELISKFMDKVKKAKSSEGRELRTNPAHTKRYTLTTHESGRRWSRRNVDKQRTTYYQCDE